MNLGTLYLSRIRRIEKILYAHPSLYCCEIRIFRKYFDRVAGIEFDLERNLFQLQDELKTQTYQPGAYTNFYIYEPKRRLLAKRLADPPDKCEQQYRVPVRRPPRPCLKGQVRRVYGRGDSAENV